MMPVAVKMSQLTVINYDKVHTDTLTHEIKSLRSTHTRRMPQAQPPPAEENGLLISSAHDTN